MPTSPPPSPVESFPTKRRSTTGATGPRTARGRAIASLNARKHGLLAREAVLPDDEEARFGREAECMRRDLAPRGALESLLVGRIVSAARRLRLLELVEAGLFARHRHEADVRKAYDTVRTYGPTDEELLTQEETPRKLEMQRQENHQSIFGKMGDEFDVAAPEFLERCKERWYEAMERRDGPIPTLAMAFLAEQKALANLARYEAAIERSLYRALHELQRIQAARSGQSVPLPAAVEVDVSVSDTRQDAA